MTNPTKAWCVFDGDGKPFIDTTRGTRTDSLKAFDRDYYWKELRRKRGYTCRKGEIREVSDE